MVFDLLHNAALVFAVCWLHSLVSRRFPPDTWAGQLLSGTVFALATVAAMMTTILLAPGLWLWTDAGAAVVAAAAASVGPIAGGLAALAGALYQGWMGGLAAGGAIVNLGLAFAAGEAARRLLARRGREPDWRAGLLLGLLVYGVGSWQQLHFHLRSEVAPTPGFFLAVVAVMAPLTALLVLQLSYVARKERLERRVTWLAHHDLLTGLPNRHRALELLEEMADRPGAALLYLRGLPLYNETLGSEVGDFLLRAAAERLREAAPAGGFAARTGGLEFLVAAPGGEVGAAAAAQTALAALAEPVPWGDKLLALDPVGGYAGAGEASEEGQALLRRAALALEAAREAPSTDLVPFDATLERRVQESLALKEALAQALAREELEVVYQPYLVLGEGEVRGVEALVRWRHPEYGLLGPEQFLAAAVHSGLITRVGAWVLERAALRFEELRRAGLDPPELAVNLALVELADRRLPERIAGILERTGLPAERLSLELSEVETARRPDTVLATAERLRAMGVRLAVDHFGAAQVSPLLLRALRPALVKVDRRYLAGDAADRRLAGALVGLARALDAPALALGVEEEATARACRELGFTLAQGYLYTRPLAAEELSAWLAAR
ncbi:MAG: hypothetical protein KatS3mg124_0187 [Porticoccaceae bacterium]|nr:MAG: hypothetical protein KatS3mg124_0187 [Porticoccaceae bacterium]